MKRIVLAICVLVSLNGCKKEQLDDCFSSTGKDRSIERPLRTFDRISVGDRFELILTQDTTQSERIIITGGENILEGISAVVENGELILSNCNTCNFVRSYKRKITLEVFLDDINEITVFGAASIKTSDTLHLQNLRINHSALEDIDLTISTPGEIFVESINSGGTKLSGKAFKLTGSIEEITDLDARNLVCEEVIFDTHSPLDCFINATKIIYVGIYGNGNIFYVNEPSLQKTVKEKTGEGNLVKL